MKGNPKSVFTFTKKKNEKKGETQNLPSAFVSQGALIEAVPTTPIGDKRHGKRGREATDFPKSHTTSQYLALIWVSEHLGFILAYLELPLARRLL